MTELSLIEKGRELTTLTTGFNGFVENLKSIEVDTSSADLSKAKNRTAVITKSADITRAKTKLNETIDTLIEAKVSKIQPELDIIKTLRANKKTVGTELTSLSKSVRKQVTDWENEEKQRVADEADKKAREELAAKIEIEHELGLLLNDNHNRELAERVEQERLSLVETERLAEEKRVAANKKIADDAAAKAKLDAEAKTAKAIQDKIDAEAAAEQAIIDKKVAEELAEKQQAAADERARIAKINAENAAKQAKIKAANDAKLAAEKATQDEIDRQEAIKAAAEKERLKVESNKKHVGKIRREIKEHVMKSTGVDEETAVKVIKSLLSIKERVTINY